jgi:hypothetical protein
MRASKSADGQAEQISMDAVITISPRRDSAAENESQPECLVQCTCQLAEGSFWSERELETFLTDFLKQLLTLRHTLQDSRFVLPSSSSRGFAETEISTTAQPSPASKPRRRVSASLDSVTGPYDRPVLTRQPTGQSTDEIEMRKVGQVRSQPDYTGKKRSIFRPGSRTPQDDSYLYSVPQKGTMTTWRSDSAGSTPRDSTRTIFSPVRSSRKTATPASGISRLRSEIATKEYQLQRITGDPDRARLHTDSAQQLALEINDLKQEYLRITQLPYEKGLRQQPVRQRRLFTRVSSAPTPTTHPNLTLETPEQSKEQVEDDEELYNYTLPHTSESTNQLPFHWMLPTRPLRCDVYWSLLPQVGGGREETSPHHETVRINTLVTKEQENMTTFLLAGWVGLCIMTTLLLSKLISSL